ncbi:hypothetical protein H0H87_011582 [Tephrocybe sp. NHM501043]|nr:hypothetical protein H0H87_011582 [Tephrocybe sp. NHM501043]
MPSIARILFTALCLVVLPIAATNNFAGIGASNSIGGKSTYTCRTGAEWNSLADTAKKNGFKSIRITGFDCNALDLASSAAAANGLTVLAGIYASEGTIAASRAKIDRDVESFRTAYAKYGAGRYVGLTVGNEVNDSPDNIMAEVRRVRGIAFYDGGRTSAQAGDFVFKTVVPALKAACPGKKIIITESGWPSRGGNNGVAVASVDDERNALLKLNCASRDDKSVSVYAFEYSDQLWKSNDNERSFGVTGKFNLQRDVFAPC